MEKDSTMKQAIFHVLLLRGNHVSSNVSEALRRCIGLSRKSPLCQWATPIPYPYSNDGSVLDTVLLPALIEVQTETSDGDLSSGWGWG